MQQDKIWDHFQNEGIDSFLRSKPRLKYIADQVDSGMKMLNIGVGGAILEELALAKRIDIFSLDPNNRTVEKLRDVFGMGEKAQAGFCVDIPYDDNVFDVVVMSEVLEHLDIDEFNKTLDEVLRVLSLNGVFIITVPNEEVLSDNDVICPKCGEKFHRWGHRQSFSMQQLNRILKDKGFDVRKIETRCFPDWERKGFVNRIKSMIKYILGRLRVKIVQPSIFIKAVKV